MIGQDIQAQPKRSHPGAAADRHRNLIVIGATAAAILVVGIAAFLIATLGGDDGDPAGGTGSPSPEQSETVTSTTDATGTGTTTGALPGVVPSVIGQSQSAAVEAVESAGLEPRIITSTSAEPEGTVIDQSPAAGTQLQQGAEVRIVVSTGQ